jgi:subtilisin-like proprotein convertase family protein
MKKSLLLSLIAVVVFVNTYGQSNLWNKVTEERLEGLAKMDRASMPSKYQLYSLNLNALKNQLITAPLDTSGQRSNLVLSFPNPDGGFDRFAFYESPVMEKGLADQFPDIKTYYAMGIDDPTASMRISFTAFGLHAMTISGNSSSVYIDTFTRDLNNFIVYRKTDITSSRQFECEFIGDSAKTIEDFTKRNTPLQQIDDSTFRTYRLAVACTGEYAVFHGGTVTLAQAAIVTTVNRLNLVFQRDLAVRFVLVANNTSIVYTDAANDPFNNDNAGTLINQSQNTINSIIGAANYDIGHTVSTGGGGLAGLGVICNNAQKARGITGSPAPVGDPFDIDYVAHEIGHQFGCNHTQNNNCQRNGATAVEPGSGSTVMAYAGICAPNVQNNSDDHFSFISLAEAQAVIQGTGCPVTSSNGNFAPVVNAGLDYTIPFSTAFILTGVATDGNNDALTYCWEQTNNEVSIQSPDPSSTSGPNFRSNIPIASPQRYMPVLTSVIANNLTPTWEVVPAVARTMNFALTVRDNRSSNGGQTGRDDMVVTTANVGPFLVNTPNTALVSWPAGSNQTVTWTVAGTTANNINAAYVDILLSNDGGLTYPIVLASKVPNDGSQLVTMPNSPGNMKRIMVRGYKHIFYDISNNNFTISTAPSTFSVAFSGVEEQQNKVTCQGTNVTYDISYLALGGFSGATTFTATGLPSGATATFSPSSISANGTVVMTIGNTASSPAGFYSITVSATSGAITKTVSYYLDLFSSTFAPMSLTTPANNATNQQTTVTLSWAANVNASSYDVQVATSNTFTTIVSSGNVTTTSYTATGLGINSDYFWRVLPKNTACGNGTFSSPFKFTTGAINCGNVASTNVPVAISASGTSTVTSTLSIPSGGIISDVNVSLNIPHTWVNDLTVALTSPSGTTIQLFTDLCDPVNGNVNVLATFDDQLGTAVVCNPGPNPAAISGTLLPAQLLSAFNGQNSTGTWTLTVTDGFNFDGGSISAWSLNICSTLGINENTFQDFALYPNPNDGNFTVKFSTASSEDVAIDVYDMRGRQIYTNEFSNNGAFNQTIDLNTVQSGVYLVSISSGDTKMVKRIIVE